MDTTPPSALPSCCSMPEYTVEYPVKGNPSPLVWERHRLSNGTISTTAFPSAAAYRVGAMCTEYVSPGERTGGVCGPRSWCGWANKTTALIVSGNQNTGADTWAWGCRCHLPWRSLTGPSGPQIRFDQPWRFPAQPSNTTSLREVCSSPNSPLFEFMLAERVINLVFFLGVLALVVVTMVQLKRLSSKSFCQTKNMLNLAVLAMNAVVLAGVAASYLFGQIMGAQHPYSIVGQYLISLTSLLFVPSLLSIATTWVHVASNAKVRPVHEHARVIYRARTLLESYAALARHPIQRVCSLASPPGARARPSLHNRPFGASPRKQSDCEH